LAFSINIKKQQKIIFKKRFGTTSHYKR